MNNNFTDIKTFTEKNNDRVFCYRSGNAVLEEVFSKGFLYTAGTNTAGYPLNVLINCDTRIKPPDYAEVFSFNAVIDGETVDRNLTFVDFILSENGCKSELILKDRKEKFTFHIFTEVDGTDVFTRYISIDNNTNDKHNISRLVIHSGFIEKIPYDDISYFDNINGKGLYDIGYFRNDVWAREGEFDFSELQWGTTVVNCKFDSDRFRHPAVFIRNNLNGNMFYIQCGWSGGVKFIFNNESVNSFCRSTLSYSVELTGHAPVYVLKPNENFVSPQVHFCAVHGDLDKAINAGIKHIRKSVLPDNVDLSVGGGMGAEHDMSVETSISFATQLHNMGADVFIIDAGWACPPEKEMEWYAYNGINRINEDRYPDDGLTRIREHCENIGMKFGMWMEPERFGKYSDIGKKHPDWIPVKVNGDKAEGYLDFTNTDVVNWVENEICYIIEKYKLDLFRLDYNVSGSECFSFNNDNECISIRHYQNIYDMFERIKNKYPDVIFENCAGGGGRTDLGFIKNFNHTWVSDNQKMPRSVEITNGMTMVLPPEKIDRLFAGMGCHTQGDMKSHLRNTMLTHMSLNVIAPSGLQVNSDSMSEIRRNTDLYKNEISKFIPECLIFHHTPTRKDIVEKGYICLEEATEDGKQGYITVFSVNYFAEKTICIKPKGIRNSFNYLVYTDNNKDEYEVNGRQLSNHGIEIKLDSSLTSEFIRYRITG